MKKQNLICVVLILLTSLTVFADGNDNVLNISLNNGRTISLKNVDKEYDYVYYTYRGADEVSGFLFVEISMPEYWEFLAINPEDGKMTRVAGLPNYNSSKTQFFCFREGNELVASAIGIYSNQDRKLAKHFEYTFDDFGAENAQWKNDNVINIDTFVYETDKFGNERKIVKHVSIINTKGAWDFNTINFRKPAGLS